jgi:hypothetical protein
MTGLSRNDHATTLIADGPVLDHCAGLKEHHDQLTQPEQLLHARPAAPAGALGRCSALLIFVAAGCPSTTSGGSCTDNSPCHKPASAAAAVPSLACCGLLLYLFRTASGCTSVSVLH